MTIVSVRSLTKEFLSPIKENKNLSGRLKSLLFRRYHRKVALNNVSFDLSQGEMVGFIGPNGAGKSTAVKILSGILLPTSGEAFVFGKIPWKHRVETVRQLGVVFGQRTQLWWDLPVIESFYLLRDIYDVDEKNFRQTFDHLVSCLDLSPFLSTPVRQLSLGQRMRCDLAASLLHRPKILFLDEPTIGLDSVSKLAVREIISTLNKEFQVTVLLTTHDMEDIESLCKRVLVLNKGELFLDGPLEKLREQVAPIRYLTLDVGQISSQLYHHPKASLVENKGHRLSFSFNPLEISAPALISDLSQHYDVHDLFVENPSIEQVIATLYKGNQ